MSNIKSMAFYRLKYDTKSAIDVLEEKNSMPTKAELAEFERRDHNKKALIKAGLKKTSDFTGIKLS